MVLGCVAVPCTWQRTQRDARLWSERRAGSDSLVSDDAQEFEVFGVAGRDRHRLLLESNAKRYRQATAYEIQVSQQG